MQIVTVHHSDFEKLVPIAERCWPSQEILQLRAFLARQIEEHHAQFFLAEKGQEVVGFGYVAPRHEYVAGTVTQAVLYLEGLFVVPEARRQGVGRALITHCQAWARQEKYQEFASDCLASNDASQALHRSCGFQPIETITCFAQTL